MSEAKHQIYKFIYDNIVQQMNKNKLSEFRELESLYLLIVLSSLGREYWLEESTLMRYLDIDVDRSGCFDRSSDMNHFSITVCLFYMRDKVRYNKLRHFIEEHVVKKVMARKSGCHKDAETLILFLDILTCPYVKDETKAKLASAFDLSDSELESVKAANPLWFTCWENFNLGRELDAKRSRDVY